MDKITKNSIKLSWNKPKNDGGSKIKGYVVEKKNKDGEWEPVKEIPANGDRTVNADVPVKPGEEAQFRVVAMNEAGPSEPSKPTKVIIAEDQPEIPKINLSGLKDITVKAGQDIQLRVPYTGGFPPPTAVWKNNDVPITDDDRTHISVNPEQMEVVLAISNAKRSDSGKITLTLKNDSGQDVGSCEIKVLGMVLGSHFVQISIYTPNRCSW